MCIDLQICPSMSLFLNAMPVRPFFLSLACDAITIHVSISSANQIPGKRYPQLWEREVGSGGLSLMKIMATSCLRVNIEDTIPASLR